MHYTINKNQYQDMTLLLMSCEWIKLKWHVKECEELRQVIIKSLNDIIWDFFNIEQYKAAETASKTKITNIEAAKIKILSKTIIKKKTAQKKIIKRK